MTNNEQAMCRLAEISEKHYFSEVRIAKLNDALWEIRIRVKHEDTRHYIYATGYTLFSAVEELQGLLIAHGLETVSKA